MKKTQTILSIALIGSLLLLSGCETIRSHNPFRHREANYAAAQQEQPLEVPPGLDNPPTSEALNVPEAGGASAGANSGMAMPQTTVEGASSSAVYPTVSGNSLTLADQPDSAYRRVGLALERGGIGTVSGHDDNAHSYQVAVNSVVTTQPAPQGGFLHRLLHHSHSETRTVTGTVNVSIAPSGSGSVANVQGDPDAVERVLSMLQQRLGGG